MKKVSASLAAALLSTGTTSAGVPAQINSIKLNNAKLNPLAVEKNHYNLADTTTQIDLQ